MDRRLVNVDIHGHGESDKKHEAGAYTAELLVGDVFAVADAEGLDEFAVWGHSYPRAFLDRRSKPRDSAQHFE